jgi:hypothetical protein
MEEDLKRAWYSRAMLFGNTGIPNPVFPDLDKADSGTLTKSKYIL